MGDQRAQLAPAHRLTRKVKKVSNDEWKTHNDPDARIARIARMKDVTMHLTYKAEHVVDLETEVFRSVAACDYGYSGSGARGPPPSISA